MEKIGARRHPKRKVYKPQGQSLFMTNPMDREFGDDPFRRMEKLKFQRRKDRQSVDEAKTDMNHGGLNGC